MHNLKLIIAYDGKNYLGWQKTPMGPSIETALQGVIEQILQHPINLQAASRTDAGVHAIGQVINFLTTKKINLSQFKTSLNSLLRGDIVILEVEEKPLAFHPTLDCTGKEYRYFVCYGPTQLPHHRFYSWHVSSLLNLKWIEQAMPLLIGKHNFASFCNVKKNAHYTDYIRDVELIECQSIDSFRLCFRLRGNHFLYKMARNLVGTLVDIGREKIALEDLSMILESKHRPQAGVTAPAHGLFLHEVFYLPKEDLTSQYSFKQSSIPS